VRVAVARDPYQALPLSGTWSGFPASYVSMDVEVDVRMADQNDKETFHLGGAINSRIAGRTRKPR